MLAELSDAAIRERSSRGAEVDGLSTAAVSGGGCQPVLWRQSASCRAGAWLGTRGRETRAARNAQRHSVLRQLHGSWPPSGIEETFAPVWRTKYHDLVPTREPGRPEVFKRVPAYTRMTARQVREHLAARTAGTDLPLPAERTLRSILNRLGYRLRRVRQDEAFKKNFPRPTPSSRTFETGSHASVAGTSNAPHLTRHQGQSEDRRVLARRRGARARSGSSRGPRYAPRCRARARPASWRSTRAS